MASPAVILDQPARHLFKLPPDAEPQVVPPPLFELPFAIPENLYQGALDWRVPATIATIYAVTAKLLNVYNKSTGKKPWAISRTLVFRVLVVLHNVFLAVYSAWTFVGMLRALRNSIVSPLGPHGLAATADSFCKLHGPAGFGLAVEYRQADGKWTAMSGNVLSGLDGTPGRADSGRLWNEGLAFYGWLFYLSKFYEVIDTLIILAKGKLSSTLQTYHHAGAMLAMWAGMRFMSAPIWMFVFVNSGIHAMMYTYYTVTAFNIRVPTIIKRSLTTCQITQFLVGASWAMLHSFVYYTVPVQVPVSGSIPAEPAAAPSQAAASANIIDSVKQIVFGAGEVAAAGKVASAVANDASAFETQYQRVSCITTSGQTFAIWLNVVYLAPLTYLFVSFFIASYIKRSTTSMERARVEKKASGADRRLSEAMQAAEKAGWDAARSVEKEIYNQGDDVAVLDDDDDARATGKKGDSRALRNRMNGAKR